MNTKKEIVDKIYYILGEDQTSTVFDKEGEVVPKLNSVVDDICRCEVTNILTGQKIRGGILDFLYNEKTLRLPKHSLLMEDIDEESVTIKLDSIDGFPAKGMIEVNGNIISYGAISAETSELLKLSGINGYHEAKSTIHYAYLLPSSILKAADFYDIEMENMLKFVDFREEIGYQRCYTLKPNKGRKVAIFYNIETPIRMSYLKRLDEMVADTDECGFPDDYGMKILPYLVTGPLLIDTSEVAKGEKLLAIGYAALEDMYSFYATPNKQFRKKIKGAPMVGAGYAHDLNSRSIG